MNFTFEITEDEAQIILDSLGKEPFNKVVTLINKLHGQAYAQRQENEKTELEETAR